MIANRQPRQSARLGFSEAYFKEGAALARAHDTTLQAHVGRDREEVEFCLSVWGRRPLERLADLGVVEPRRYRPLPPPDAGGVLAGFGRLVSSTRRLAIVSRAISIAICR